MISSFSTKIESINLALISLAYNADNSARPRPLLFEGERQ